MPLRDLGNELLLCISESLELERDINAFSQSNRRLHDLLNTYLYRHNIQQLGSSGLLWVAEHGREAAARKFMEEGANIGARGGVYGTALRAASIKGHEAIVALLLENGADVNARDGYNSRYNGNALYAASSEGHHAVVALLLEKGANVNAQDGDYGSALYEIGRAHV